MKQQIVYFLEHGLDACEPVGIIGDYVIANNWYIAAGFFFIGVVYAFLKKA